MVFSTFIVATLGCYVVIATISLCNKKTHNGDVLGKVCGMLFKWT